MALNTGERAETWQIVYLSTGAHWNMTLTTQLTDPPLKQYHIYATRTLQVQIRTVFDESKMINTIT